MSIVLELRRRAGLTQDLLAKLSGVSSASISRYEAGTRTPTLATLARLAEAAELQAIVSFVPNRRDDRRRAFAFRLDGAAVPQEVPNDGRSQRPAAGAGARATIFNQK